MEPYIFITFCISLFAFSLWRSWSFKKLVYGKTDQEFIERITNDRKADELITKLSSSRTQNKIMSNIFIALCIVFIYLDKDGTDNSNIIFIAMFMGFAAIQMAQSFSDDNKIKLIFLAKKLKHNSSN